MKVSKFCAAFVAAVVFVFSPIWADGSTTAVWTNDFQSTALWTEPLNWTDGDGNALAEAPTNGAWDVVISGSTNILEMQTIQWRTPAGMTGGKTYAASVKSLAEQSLAGRRIINLYNDWNVLKDVGFALTFNDLTSFEGYFSSRYGKASLIFPATAEKPFSVGHASPAKRLEVNVPNSDGTVTLQTLYEAGTLDKTGSGTLVLGGARGSDNVVHVAGGTLELAGRDFEPEAGDDLPVPGAWLHLDANKPDTFKTCEIDGRTCVTNWADVRGGDRPYAYFDDQWDRGTKDYLIETTHPPFMDNTLVAGRTVMNFGRAASSQDESFGPVGCCLNLSSRTTKLRTVFFVGQYLPASTSTTILGDYVDNNYPFHRAGSLLVSSSLSCHPVRYGDNIVNGVPSANTYSGYTLLHVVASTPTNAITLGALGSDRNYAGRVGGCRIAEVILFTNRLTHAQMQLVSDHLLRKWKGNSSADCELGAVVMGAGSDSVSVPAGCAARVESATAASGTLVKTGAGKLSLGSLAQPLTTDAPAVDVRAGTVVFERSETPAADVPADSPYFWLDAADSASFVISNRTGSTEDYVARWNDCRPEQTEVYAKTPTDRPDYINSMNYNNGVGMLPTRQANVVGDKAVVDFGPPGVTNSQAAFMDLSTDTGANCLEAFIVMRFTTATRGLNLFGSSHIQLYRASTSRCLSGGYGHYSGMNAFWTVNGVPVDPIAPNQCDLPQGQFHVVSVSSASPSEKLYVDLLAKDRLKQGTSWGGVQVAEQILYDRTLTPAERRQTIAYLMNRWLDRNPPDVGTTRLAKMTFPADAAVTVETEGALAVDDFAGGNGTFVKKGAGALSMPLPADNGFTSIDVQEGSVTAAFDYLIRAAYHFDASDAASLTDYYVTEDGARTNVTAIADVRANGLTADAWLNPDATYVKDGVTNSCGICYTNPVWTVKQMPDGVMRPAFDFGRRSNYHGSKYPSSSGFKMSSRFTNIREVFAIFSKNDAGDTAAVFTDSSHYHFHHSGAVLFSITYAAPAVTNGIIAMDGVQVGPFSAWPGAGFHLFSVATTGDTSIGTIAIERNIDGGGNFISEYIGFTNVLSTGQRKFLQDSLMHKWFGAAKPVWPETIDVINVAAGTALNVAGGDVVLNVTKITGTGAITGADLAGIAEIEVFCTGGTTVPATVEGNIAFATNTTVRLTGDALGLDDGMHTLVTGGALSVAGVNWNVDGYNTNHYMATVLVDGNVLKLRLARKGTTVLLR